MADSTPLDRAHASMSSNPDDDSARLRFYERLADSELFLMLEETATQIDDSVAPEVFDLGDARYVLVFDREERLAAFAGRATPYIALSGRNIASMLEGQEIGLGVNLDVAPSAILLPHTAVQWLRATLGNTPSALETAIRQVHPPGGLPEKLIEAIDAKLVTAMGLARCAYLVGVTYEDMTRGHLLGFVDAVAAAKNALAQAAAEALTFSGIDAGELDVAFFRSKDKIVDRLERVGLRFDLPQMQAPVTQLSAAPGMDPQKPPKLK